MDSNPRPDVETFAQRGDSTLVVAISSRALFDLGESHALFER
jgi:5'-nucleotidase